MLNEIVLLSGVVDLCIYLCIYLNVSFAAFPVSCECFPDWTAPSCGRPGSRSVLWLPTESWEIDCSLAVRWFGWHGGGVQYEPPSKLEVPVCVTVQTESADCRWYEGNRCRLVLLSCSSGRCHFLEEKKMLLLPRTTSPSVLGLQRYENCLKRSRFYAIIMTVTSYNDP